MYSSEYIAFHYFSSLFFTTVSDAFGVSEQIESDFISRMLIGFGNPYRAGTSSPIENSRTLHITCCYIYVYSPTGVMCA